MLGKVFSKGWKTSGSLGLQGQKNLPNIGKAAWRFTSRRTPEGECYAPRTMISLA